MGTISCINTVSLNGACTRFFAADSLSSKASSVFFNNRTWKLKSRPLVASSSSSMATNFQVTASSSIGAVKEEQKGVSSGRVGENDLLIVGPGVLGRLVAEQWRQVLMNFVLSVVSILMETKSKGLPLAAKPLAWVGRRRVDGQWEHPGCQIYGQTMTADHHDELINMGITPSLKWTEATQKFPYVIFCAPPSRSLDYPGDVRLAALSWNGEGSFLFTSTSAIFDCSDNGACDEDGPVVPIGRSPRTDVLLKAEKVILEFGGCVLRLAGLYKADRGAHVYWLQKGTVDSRPDHILNLIHYEDAASLSIAMLKKKIRGQIFLGCDNHPLSRQEIMDLVAKSGKFSKKFEGFTGTSGPLGKRLNNSKTREEIGWEPKYPSFAHFLGVAE